jgi:hypothetical protein
MGLQVENIGSPSRDLKRPHHRATCRRSEIRIDNLIEAHRRICHFPYSENHVIAAAIGQATLMNRRLRRLKIRLPIRLAVVLNHTERLVFELCSREKLGGVPRGTRDEVVPSPRAMHRGIFPLRSEVNWPAPESWSIGLRTAHSAPEPAY